MIRKEIEKGKVCFLLILFTILQYSFSQEVKRIDKYKIWDSHFADSIALRKKGIGKEDGIWSSRNDSINIYYAKSSKDSLLLKLNNGYAIKGVFGSSIFNYHPSKIISFSKCELPTELEIILLIYNEKKEYHVFLEGESLEKISSIVLSPMTVAGKKSTYIMEDFLDVNVMVLDYEDFLKKLN